MKSEKQKMLAGKLYRANDPELQADLRANAVWLAEYNACLDATKRHDLLLSRLAFVGNDALIRPPFFCDYGFNIRLGEGAFLNFNCIILDVAMVTIGDGAQIGPAVQILAADHPRDPHQRRGGLERGRPVSIGRNVWVGGGALILPGVAIGDDAIVGAGAVVTHDVASGVTVVGNPARQI
jgi:maltose O-acetyltransferase